MVKFYLTKHGYPKTYTGIISERWAGVYSTQIYKINCMEKGMMPYSVEADLIIEKIA